MATGAGMRGIVTGGITTGRPTVTTVRAGMTGRTTIGLGGPILAIGIGTTRRAIGIAIRTGIRPMRSIVIAA